MFVAISAFVLQGTLISISQAAAATGIMLEPSVTLSGSLHFHDQLAGNVHEHGSNSAEGHVHDPSQSDSDDDGGVMNSSWTIFGASVLVPACVAYVCLSDFLGRVELPAPERADGVEPGALIRPPSTFSIA